MLLMRRRAGLLTRNRCPMLVSSRFSLCCPVPAENGVGFLLGRHQLCLKFAGDSQRPLSCVARLRTHHSSFCFWRLSTSELIIGRGVLPRINSACKQTWELLL